MPDVQKELRVEIREALSQTSGVFTSQALQNMKKMDSFLKEVLRLHPATMGEYQNALFHTLSLTVFSLLPTQGSSTIHSIKRPKDPRRRNNRDPRRRHQRRLSRLPQSRQVRPLEVLQAPPASQGRRVSRESSAASVCQCEPKQSHFWLW